MLCGLTFLSSGVEELLVVFYWRAWFRRNSLVHSSKLLSVEGIACWAELFLVEFRSSCVRFSRSRIPIVERWKAPSPGWFKINSDFAIDVCGGRTGLGITDRNEAGLVMLSCVIPVVGMFSPVMAEAMALLHGLQLAVDYGICPCYSEADATSVVQQMSSKVSSCSDVNLVVDDILSLVASLYEFSVSWVRKSVNSVAQELAKWALSLDSDCRLIEDFPSYIARSASQDIQFCL
ncbi:hypothetical protein ACOSQ4_027403 [Xanthoceras sorbifolium]